MLTAAAGVPDEAAEAARLACEAPEAVGLLRTALAHADPGDVEARAALLERLSRCLYDAGDTELVRVARWIHNDATKTRMPKGGFPSKHGY